MVNRKRDIRAEEMATNRVMISIVLAFVFMFILGFISRMFLRGSTFMGAVLTVQIVMWICAIFIVLGIFYCCKNRDNDEKSAFGRLFCMSGIIGCIAMTLIYLNVGVHAVVISFLYVMIPICALLHLIYNLYPKDFFAISLCCVVSGICVWIRVLSISHTGLLRLASIIAILGTIGCYVAHRVYVYEAKKRRAQFKKTVTVKSRDGLQTAITVLLMVTAIFCAYSLPISAQIMYFIFFGIVAYFFVAAVYYTVKLI